MKRNAIIALLARVKKELHYSAAGQMLSPRKGEGFDFAELIPYREGMDARKIFWKSLARGEALQYKTFFEEREVQVAVALMLSGSLLVGEPLSKLEKAFEAAALYALAAQQSGNLFHGLCWSAKETFATPPSKSYHALERFLFNAGEIDLFHTACESDAALVWIEKRLRRKSLLVLIGDFLEPCDLRRLAARHAVVAIIVRDRFEAQPTPLGEVVFEDPETGEAAEIWFGEKEARAYAEAFAEHDRKLLASFHRLGVTYRYLYTDEPLS